MSSKSAEGTASLDKALDVLEAIGSSLAGLSQAELAAQLSLPRTTMYRLLATLVARGLIRRDPLRRVYCLGFRCFEYARAAYSMPDLVAAAGAELRALRDMTGETSYLAALDGLEVISLERCDGAHSLRSQAALGQRKPLHCTSQGKAILSALPAAQRDALIKDMTLAALTPRTITDRRRLQAELKLTITRGYSIDDEEIALGVRCCGAPIVDADGQVRGAISVAGPAFRLSMQRIDLLGPEVAAAARRIGAQLDATQVRGIEGPAQAIEGEWAFQGAFPRWSAHEGALYWADRLAPAVRRCVRHDDCIARLDAPIEALLLHADGVVVQQASKWWHVGADGEIRTHRGLPGRRLCAVCVDGRHRLWACHADGDRWRIGVLTAEGALVGGWRLAEPVTALAWGADGDTMFAVATDSGTLYTMRDGSPTVRRLATVPKGSGRLSGLAVDQHGGLWSALLDGWSVVRFEHDGSLDRVIGLPVPSPTDVGFGAGDTLYVTSRRDTASRDALESAPLSGRLFAVKTDYAGVAQTSLE
jgi:DNA-binding IclR family transcriptional regulator/sugar lactone lactonase YvrE